MPENSTSVVDFGKLTFSWTDYSLFGSLIGLSLIIGLYFGICGKQNNRNEYIFGGKTMGYFPVATSMLAGHVSGISLLGGPTETYQHGASYLLVLLTIAITMVVVMQVFLPVFYKLQLSSTYEYLELRFSRRIRIVAAFLYVLSLLMYIPLVVYVPALAFSQVTGYNLYLITPVLCIICIVYTSVGGVKAVIWTDTIQFAFTIVGVLAVFYLGLVAVGSLSEIWDIAEAGNRTKIFDFSPSPFVRKSFWAMSISFSFQFVSHFGVSQNCVQRFLSIPTQRDARKAIIILGVGMGALKVVVVLIGLIIFAKYDGCDPIKAKIIPRTDQILPYYVMDVAGHIAGLPGIFLAGLVSCALSTMSAALNTLAGTIYDDFIDQWLPESKNKEARATNIMKVISVLVGVIGMISVFIIEHLGTVFELGISIRSIAEGPLLALFMLGMLFPWVGNKGVTVGTIVSLIVMNWLVIGTQWNVYKKRIHNPSLPTSIEKCSNATIAAAAVITQNGLADAVGNDHEFDQPWAIFRISMMHFTMIGTMLVIIVALITSYFTGEMKNVAKTVNPDYIHPAFHRFLPRRNIYKLIPVKEITTKNNGPEVDLTPSEPVNCTENKTEDVITSS